MERDQAGVRQGVPSGEPDALQGRQERHRRCWFARGFDTALPSFDQHTAAANAGSDERSLRSHADEFRVLRAATLAFFENLPRDAWLRRGVASDNPFSVRALAWIAAGHVAHHARILRERYF